MKTGSTTASSGRWFSTRDVLLVVQIALCAVLVTASLVAVRGLVRSLHSSLGFQPQNVLLVSTDLNMAGYHGDQVPVMQRRMLDAVANIPGVASVGFVDYPAPGPGLERNLDLCQHHHRPAGVQLKLPRSYNYSRFSRILSGGGVRPCWREGRSTGVTIRMRRKWRWSIGSLRAKVFGSVAQAVGGSFQDRMKDQRIEVAGVVEDGKYKTLTEDPAAGVLSPHAAIACHCTWLVVRSTTIRRTWRGRCTTPYVGWTLGCRSQLLPGKSRWTARCLPRAQRRFLWECWACSARCWRLPASSAWPRIR